MKKLFIYSLTASFAIGILSGCKKLLDVTPKSSITEAIYFKNEGDFEPYVTGIYTYMRSLQNNITYGTERSEELISASNSRFTVAWSQNLSASSGAINYNDWYRAIGHCNLLLAKIKDFDFTLNPDDKPAIMAETYALRGFFYFHLTRIIGDAPLMLDPVVDENVPLLARSPAKDVVQQIVSDLDSAILLFKSIPSYNIYAYPSKYRFAYGSVQTLKADVKLWDAKVLNGGNQDFTDAIAALSEVEKTGVSLNSDFANVTGLKASSNPEDILAAYYNRDETGNNYVVNAFPFINIVAGALNIDSIPYTQSSATGQGAYQISDESKDLFNAHPEDKRIPWTWVTERQSDGPKVSWITKYRGNIYADGRVPDNDLIMYRLADVYLMEAEAYAGLSDIDNAVSYLNKVKQRAGIGDYAGNMDKQSVEKEILDERGRELYFENKRWYDLVRFHYGGTIDVYNYVPNLMGKTTPLFWPLNTTVLGNNDLLTQTQGY